jgi:hypothetical protein
MQSSGFKKFLHKKSSSSVSTLRNFYLTNQPKRDDNKNNFLDKIFKVEENEMPIDEFLKNKRKPDLNVLLKPKMNNDLKYNVGLCT